MKRTKEDLCLLCGVNKATQTNSHIVPKFIGKSILGDTGARKAFILDTSKPHIKPKIQQDSPKEDYILCPSCEGYFSILETYTAENLEKRLYNPKYIADFPENTAGEVDYIICKDIDVKLYRLFILSIYWRCSIASVPPFTKYQCSYEHELKSILLKSKDTDITGIKQSENHPQLFFHTLYIIRGEEGHDKTENYLLAQTNIEGIDQLVMNENMIFLSKRRTDIYILRQLGNSGNFPIIMVLYPPENWTNLNKGLYDHAGNLAAKKAIAFGVTPYTLNR